MKFQRILAIVVRSCHANLGVASCWLARRWSFNLSAKLALQLHAPKSRVRTTYLPTILTHVQLGALLTGRVMVANYLRRPPDPRSHRWLL